ncbi:MAG: serine/threonine protein kinase [Verrucomicrobiaceae bacterium]|nr:MAG: serine/threonine protein kinase [Verrucomicrobiaceae bacterium]
MSKTPTSKIKLAHFDLLEEIGHGGLGVVFRAFDPSLNRHVAIKVLKEEFAQDPKFVEDFLRESKNAAAVSHPHIAQIHFVGEADENRYMVMELVSGRSLEQIVQQDGPMPEAKALQVAIDIAEALKAGYAVNQMIHGDIKPQNIVVGDECGAKLLDFGLAQLANVEVDNSSDAVWGSPYYISPERVGRKAEDFRSDIYSLGATIFEALVGRPPFDAEDSTELALKRLNEKPALLRTLNPNISKRTEQIINKMLQKNLLMRYIDYDALLSDLHKAHAAASGHAPMTDTMDLRRMTGHITGPVPVPPTRSLLPVILAASLVSCLLAGGVFYFLVGKKPAQQAAPPTTSQPPVAVSATPSPAASPSPGSSTASKEFDKGIEMCDRYLLDCRRKEAAKELQKLTPSNPYEEAQLSTRTKRMNGQGQFKKLLDEDVNKGGYPLQMMSRDGKKYAGGTNKASPEGFSISTPSGEVSMRMGEISPETILAMHEYYVKKAVGSDDVAHRNWLAGITAVTLGLKTEGKALMEKAGKDKPVLYSKDKMLEILGR